MFERGFPVPIALSGIHTLVPYCEAWITMHKIILSSVTVNAAVYKLVFSVHIHMYAHIMCYNCMYLYVYVCTYSSSVNVFGCFEVVHTIVLNVECIQHRLKQI